MSLLNKILGVYTCGAVCTNCGRIFTLSIPRGVTAKEFFEKRNGECIECGCTTLKQHPKIKYVSPSVPQGPVRP